jgi:hypothetical protein
VGSAESTAAKLNGVLAAYLTGQFEMLAATPRGVFWPEMGLRCAGAMTGAADGFAAKMEGGRDWTLVQVTAGISA